MGATTFYLLELERKQKEEQGKHKEQEVKKATKRKKSVKEHESE